jgi:hypothetical protein
VEKEETGAGDEKGWRVVEKGMSAPAPRGFRMGGGGQGGGGN